MVRELMQSIGNRKVPEDGIALLPEEVILNSYDFQDDVLVIDFSAQYHEMFDLLWRGRSLRIPGTIRSGI